VVAGAAPEPQVSPSSSYKPKRLPRYCLWYIRLIKKGFQPMLASIMSLLLAFVVGTSGSNASANKPLRSPSPLPTSTAVSTMYEVPLSSVTIPSQCKSDSVHYTTAFNAPAGSEVQGTSGNDVIFAGSESIVHGGAGNDCIVLASESEGYGDNGNDILISEGGDNVLDGGTGSNTAYYHKLTDIIKNFQTAHAL
jgi:hypothetical protein